MQNWYELNSELKTYWYEAGVFDEEDYLDWIEVGVKSPAQVLAWRELGVLVPPTVQLLMRYGIKTPDELRRRLFGKWRFGLPYTVRELLVDLSDEFDWFNEF